MDGYGSIWALSWPTAAGTVAPVAAPWSGHIQSHGNYNLDHLKKKGVYGSVEKLTANSLEAIPGHEKTRG